MKIGIIVYSHTGHTLMVAKKLHEKLSAGGHQVNLEQIEAAGTPSFSEPRAALKTAPGIAPYDAVVFAGPVWGGRSAGPMVSYMEQLPGLQDKQVVCMVTGFFPARWGCDQTLAQMKEVCTSRAGTVIGTGSVTWFGLGRRRRINQMVEKLSSLF
jgi:flavodoxin